MNFETVKYEVADGIATMTLNRPHKRNALDLLMRREIADVVRTVNLDPSVRVFVMMSSGGSFCSGGDISTMQTREPDAAAGRRRMRDNWDWIDQLVHLDRPVIAAVDGPAVGAGFNLALAADFILATPNAYFCESFAKIGLIPDLGGLYMLPRIVGLQRAKEIVFSARRISAEEAVSLGIAWKIVPSDTLADAANALARSLTHCSATAMGLAKGILNASSQSDLRTVLEMEASANGICFETDYHRDAIKRFLGKEPMAFSGFAANDPEK
jgi:2-(1,2-epoxy-1,2-dihydrophenyl)acetyl-CoA isomerase